VIAACGPLLPRFCAKPIKRIEIVLLVLLPAINGVGAGEVAGRELSRARRMRMSKKRWRFALRKRAKLGGCVRGSGGDANNVNCEK
jgi:hypothetical protein